MEASWQLTELALVWVGSPVQAAPHLFETQRLEEHAKLVDPSGAEARETPLYRNLSRSQETMAYAQNDRWPPGSEARPPALGVEVEA